MLETLLITFREGLEAFLIVAIMLAYVTNTGRHHLVKPIFAGIGVALLISATTGWHVSTLAQDPVWEGTLSIIAGVLVASFTIHIMRAAKRIRQDIGDKIERAISVGEETLAEIGVFAFTVLMVAREGMETALMLGAISGQTDATAMWAGAALGFALVGVIGYLWKTQSAHINLKLFMQVTGIFLVLFSIDLFVYGLHELSEMSALPFIGEEGNIAFHIWSEPIEEGWVSTLVTFGLIAVPCGWLLLSFLRDKYGRRDALQAAE